MFIKEEDKKTTDKRKRERERERERPTGFHVDNTGDIPIGNIDVERLGHLKHYKTTKDERRGGKKKVSVPFKKYFSKKKKTTRQRTLKHVGSTGHIPIGDINVERIGTVKH